MVWDGGLDARYQDAVSRPYRQWTRLDVYSRAGALLYQGVPYAGGSLTANLQQRVTRRLTFTLPDSNQASRWFPVTPAGDIDPSGLLAPYGNRIRATQGIEYGDGSRDAFPIFYGRIDQPGIDQSGLLAIQCVDLAGDVADAVFETPTNSVPGNTVLEEWQRLILAALPDATFGTSTGGQTGSLIGPLSWEADRGQALDNMAAGVGCTWWALADGSFVLRQSPWSMPGLTPALTLSDGDGPGQRTIGTYAVSLPRSGLANAVVFSAERLDGSPPLTAIARDMDATSPTYYYGDFGRKPILIQNQAPTTQAQVEYAARVQLHYAKALTQTWENVSIVPDASLELGDLFLCQAGGIRSLQVLTGFTLPLRESGPMPLTLRAYSPLTGV